MPGKPDESLLWTKIAQDEMPKTDNKVSQASNKLIRAWIEAGAPGEGADAGIQSRSGRVEAGGTRETD